MGVCYAGPIVPEYDGVNTAGVNEQYTKKEDTNKERTNIVSQPTVDKQGKNAKPPKAPIPSIPHYTHQQTSLAMRTIDELKDDEDQMSPLSKNHNEMFRQMSLQELILSNEEEFTMEEVSSHNKVDDVWIILNNNVYDVTDFWQQHPVNPQYVFKYGGQDATDPFNAAGHSQYAEKLAANMKIGVLAKKDRKNHSDKRKMSVVNWDSLEQTNLQNEVRIKHINVYPVKGCRGVELESTWIDQSGVYNDRMYCFVDADTHNPINQLKYQKLSLIQPVLGNIGETEDMHSIELYYFDERTGDKNSIIVKSKYDKNEMIEIEYVNSDTKILSYDQGDKIADWITNYLHSTTNIKDKNKTFRFCKILRTNFRPHKDYFSLPFISKQDQPIKGVLNYSAINLASQESLNELNRRWYENDADNKPFGWETWRVNIVLEGLPKAHFEDFAKFVTINNDVELLWNRRRYLCTVPNVKQSKGVQTNEPQDTLTRYRNAVTLNDTTAKPGTNGVFFGSFFLVKQGGQIRVGDAVNVKQTQFNILRTNRQKSYYGHTNVPSGNKNFSVKTLTQYQSYTLAAKNMLTHDTYHLRFELADKNTSNLLQHESLRLNIGGHYLLKIPENSRYLLDNYENNSDDEKISYGGDKISIIRAYTPVVLDEEDSDESYFDLVVKIYENGAMTQYFKYMQIGDLIDGKQYYGGIRYTEIGKFRFGDPSHFQVKHWTFNVNYINMICGGTGVCPMMQIIQCIHKNGNIDKTKINVLYSNKTVNDILMIDLLNEMEKTNENIKVYHVITTKEDKPENKSDELLNKKGLKITQFGKRINRDFIEKYGFKHSDDCISLLCGPPRMDIAMNQICKEIGFDEKHIHTF